ncbi:unnamed protein product [Protopolystoma xenopodis]|uniref:Uncharacterized protein n=1 Tax=Protopolystoma xenopodis TaxID=117903 RepID=A0A448WG25_9PLAT|nr:unnamed protein product [Protopolystoma xenopodis]
MSTRVVLLEPQNPVPNALSKSNARPVLPVPDACLHAELAVSRDDHNRPTCTPAFSQPVSLCYHQLVRCMGSFQLHALASSSASASASAYVQQTCDHNYSNRLGPWCSIFALGLEFIVTTLAFHYASNLYRPFSNILIALAVFFLTTFMQTCFASFSCSLTQKCVWRSLTPEKTGAWDLEVCGSSSIRYYGVYLRLGQIGLASFQQPSRFHRPTSKKLVAGIFYKCDHGRLWHRIVDCVYYKTLRQHPNRQKRDIRLAYALDYRVIQN